MCMNVLFSYNQMKHTTIPSMTKANSVSFLKCPLQNSCAQHFQKLHVTLNDYYLTSKGIEYYM